MVCKNRGIYVFFRKKNIYTPVFTHHIWSWLLRTPVILSITALVWGHFFFFFRSEWCRASPASLCPLHCCTRCIWYFVCILCDTAIDSSSVTEPIVNVIRLIRLIRLISQPEATLRWPMLANILSATYCRHVSPPQRFIDLLVCATSYRK